MSTSSLTSTPAQSTSTSDSSKSDAPNPPTSTETGQSSQPVQPLVVQIVVRRDLLDTEGWGMGPLMAQTAHAAVAVLHETRKRPETIEYLSNLSEMRKAVLQTKDLTSLTKLSNLLKAASPPIPHHVWVELPENVPTCLALAPNRREAGVRKALDKAGCRLWKG